MKIEANALLAILIINIAAIFITALLTVRDSVSVETRIISHTLHGEGYQLTDSVNQRTCLVYPDALEPGDMLDCWSFE